MMRARVAAQFGTLVVFMGYYGLNNFDFKMAPMYQAAHANDDDEKKKEDGTK